MGVLYGWATPEYLFEHMSFGQIVLYLNEGMKFKYPKPPAANNSTSLVGASDDEIRRRRDQLREKFGYIGVN